MLSGHLRSELFFYASKPKIVAGAVRYGFNMETGLPFFVITISSPVWFSSFIRCKHFALNSEALIVRIFYLLSLLLSVSITTFNIKFFSKQQGDLCGVGDEKQAAPI